MIKEEILKIINSGDFPIEKKVPGYSDNIAEYGFDSIEFIKLTIELENKFDVEMLLDEIDSPEITVNVLADAINKIKENENN